MFADDDFDIDAEVVRVPEDFDDAAFGGAIDAGKVGDLDVDGEAFERIVKVLGAFGPALEGFFAEDAMGIFGGS